MKSNVGGIDRMIRIVLSMFILGAGFYIPSWWGLVGLLPLLTGIAGWCPLYSIFGINTCRKGDVCNT